MGVPYAEVIGDPIAHSKSPAIHGFWLEKLGLEGDYRARRVSSEALSAYVASRRDDPDWRGCNLTMPLKEAALPHAGRLDPFAARAGAVNTLARKGCEGLKGFNTDAMAVAELLAGAPRADYPARIATYVQVVGAGGAARAAVIGAVEAGYADFEFYNRTLARARAMAAWLGLAPDAYARPLDALGPIRNPDDGPDDQRVSHVVVNATSLGMLGNPDVPISLDRYYADTVVLDMAYGAAETKLVREARRLGLTVVDGLQLLVAQAAHAFRLFFDAEAPREHDAQLRELLTR